MTDHYYIHIPFCRQRCPYCKFALTPVFDEFKKKRYIEYLKKEIREYFSIPFSFDQKSMENGIGEKNQKTIYLGGGTPSVLSHSEIQDILECFPFYKKSPIEITLEANPEDITTDYIEGILELGVNRISLGIQTLDEKSLKEIHRSDKDTIFGALESIGFGILKSESEISLNIDFILGIPYTLPGNTLKGIQELHNHFPQITHTSVYMLEDEKYPKHWKANSISEIELQGEFLDIIEYFKSLGWDHYELSNWAKPGYRSIHNQAYWDHSNSRGFGLSAASYENGMRWSNSSSFSGYYGGKRDNEEILTPEQIEIEKMMFGLRRDGIKIQGSKLQIQDKKIRKFQQDGLLEIHENTIKTTKTGIFVIDHILSELLVDS